MSHFTESEVESAALAWLEAADWRIAHGPEITPAGDALSPSLTPTLSQRERESFREEVLSPRLRDALARLNPHFPAEALEEAFRKLTRPEGADLIQRNRVAPSPAY